MRGSQNIYFEQGIPCHSIDVYAVNEGEYAGVQVLVHGALCYAMTKAHQDSADKTFDLVVYL